MKSIYLLNSEAWPWLQSKEEKISTSAIFIFSTMSALAEMLSVLTAKYRQSKCFIGSNFELKKIILV